MSSCVKKSAFFVFALAMSTLAARADNAFWYNTAGDYDFANAANWDIGYPEGHTAIIQNNGHANVVSLAGTVANMYLGANLGGTVGLDPMGTGTLNVQTGGVLTSTSSVYVGEGDANEGTVNVTGGSFTSGALCLGYGLNSKGTLNVDGGEYQGTGYLYAGWNEGSLGYMNLSNGSLSTPSHVRLGYKIGAVGVFNQTGGTLSAGTVYAGMADGAYGYYRLAAGEFTGAGLSPGASAGGVGAIEQEAGTVLNIGSYGIRVGSGTSGIGLFNQKGGTANLERVLWAGGNGTGCWGQIELSGTTTVTAVEYTSVGRHAGSFGYLNLNATGTLTTPNVRFHATEAGGGRGVFTFSGGTLKANASTPDPADPATHFMRREAGATGDISILIGAQGGTIDTDGYDVVISEPLQAMTGHGVSSIGLMMSGTGYDGPPVVQISGGSGRGATAVATVANGEVTGITVTNSGTGYTSGDILSVNLAGGGPFMNAIVGSVNFAPNAVDGGLKKQGLGTLTLAGENTYAGLTDVQMGTLNLSGSLIGDVVVQADGTLMGSGGAVGGNVDVDGTLAVAYDSDSDTINVLNIAGELDLTGAILGFSDVGTESLAVGDYVFATYGTLVGTPASYVGLQAGWSIDYAHGGNSIALLVTGSAPIPGDADNSGTVDETDAKYLAENWGKGPTATWEMGDFSGDGWVNAIDAAILAAHWGTSGTPEAVGVPEPSVLIAIIGGLLTAAWIRRKR